MTRIATALSLLATGCVVVAPNGSGTGAQDRTEPVDSAPVIRAADAGCYWDDWNADFVWWFEADVTDPDGVGDVSAVYADVYDYDGSWADSFELYLETDDPSYWFSDWLESSTWLDCTWSGYTVEIVAYDRLDAYDAVDFAPATW